MVQRHKLKTISNKVSEAVRKIGELGIHLANLSSHLDHMKHHKFGKTKECKSYNHFQGEAVEKVSTGILTMADLLKKYG